MCLPLHAVGVGPAGAGGTDRAREGRNAVGAERVVAQVQPRERGVPAERLAQRRERGGREPAGRGVQRLGRTRGPHSY